MSTFTVDFSTEISKIKEFFAHFKTNISEIIKKYLCSCPKHKVLIVVASTCKTQFPMVCIITPCSSVSSNYSLLCSSTWLCEFTCIVVLTELDTYESLQPLTLQGIVCSHCIHGNQHSNSSPGAIYCQPSALSNLLCLSESK